MAKTLYIRDTKDWDKLVRLLNSADLYRDRQREIGDISVYHAFHITITDTGWYIRTALEMRHAPCIKVDDNWMAQLELVQFDKEVLRAWLLA